MIQMEELPENLVPTNINNFDKLLVDQYLCYVRLEIVEFILQKSNQYYDFTQFFQKYEIKDLAIQNKIIDGIIAELKEKQWKLGKMFGGTALVICPSSETLKTSLWASSLDFEEI